MIQRRSEDRLANPSLQWHLRSPFDWPASWWSRLCSYEGRQSGRRYTIPRLYARIAVDGDPESVVLTPCGETVWWRNLREPQVCTLVVGGRDRAATGAVVSRSKAGPFLGAYFQTYPVMGRLLGYGGDSTGSPTGHQRASRRLAVVRFRLVNG